MVAIRSTLIAATFAVCVAAQQIADGQVIASTTVAPATQIGDGQIQVTTSAPAVVPVSQISDGQIQAPTGISSGAPAPSPNGTTIAPVTPTPSAFTGAANVMAWSKEIAVVAVGAVAGLVML